MIVLVTDLVQYLQNTMVRGDSDQPQDCLKVILNVRLPNIENAFLVLLRRGLCSEVVTE